MGDEDQERLFRDDILPPSKKRRNVDASRVEHNHIIPPDQDAAQFAGETYEAKHDQRRLTGQLKRVNDLMSDRKWRTLNELEADLKGEHEGCEFLQTSLSAALRSLRYVRNGEFKVDRRSRGERGRGLYEYRVRPASDDAPEDRGGAKR